MRFKAGHGPSSTPGEAMGLAYSHSTDDEQGTAVYTIRDSGTAEDKIIKLRAMSSECRADFSSAGGGGGGGGSSSSSACCAASSGPPSPLWAARRPAAHAPASP